MVELHAYRHPKATRKNLPTDQTERFMEPKDYEEQSLTPDRLDNTNHPVLQWNRTERQEFEHGPLYTHEKILPAMLIQSAMKDDDQLKMDLFSQFNGLPENADYEWYEHEGYWQNQLIHGDGKRVMASLAEREGLAGKVQMVYMDPPYNIKFNANFQLKTDELEVSESGDFLPHDPMAVKAFRDAYAGNIHTFLDNLHEQLTLARELLTESGSCFVQIGYENVHEVACLMNEVFGKENHVATIPYVTATNPSGNTIGQIGNWIIWFAKKKAEAKYRQLYEKLDRKGKINTLSYDAACENPEGKTRPLNPDEREQPEKIPDGTKIIGRTRLTGSGTSTTGGSEPFQWNGKQYGCPQGEHWRVNKEGMEELARKGRLTETETGSLRWKLYEEEIPGRRINSSWTNLSAPRDKRYIVQSPETTIERCILMTTDPGDLVLDPTCGSGTTAYVAERWGRRWITIDTSRVAIAVARQRLATSKFDYFLLEDSEEGAKREVELPGAKPLVPSGTNDVQKGFVYPRIPRVSAATLAYGIEEYIYLVDQPERNPRKTRVCSAFTVESDSRAAALRTDQEEESTLRESPTRDQILEALPVAGFRYGKDHWQVMALEPHPHTYIVTHTATLLEKKSGKKLRAGVYIAPEDTTTSPHHIRQAVREVPNMVPERDTLLVISFAYEAPATAGEYQNMGSVQVIRAEANKDLTIPGLTNSPGDNSFVVVGEPDAVIRKAPNGQLELEVHGVDTYDPKINTVRAGEVRDIHCIMTDTDFDGLSFRVRRINFPNQTKDRQLERMKRDLRRHIDDEKWNRLMTAVTIPFDPPESSKVAVKVIDKAGMETMRVLDVENIS